jgi:hypothetical protein
MGDFDVKNKARHEHLCLPKISKSEKGERFLRPRDSRPHAKPTRTNCRFNNGNCHTVLTLAHAWSCARTEPDIRLSGNNTQLSISRRDHKVDTGFGERQIAQGDFVEEYGLSYARLMLDDMARSKCGSLILTTKTGRAVLY